jgi:type II secretory pathway pseudopilin PulG
MGRIRWSLAPTRDRAQDQTGLGLVETLVAIAILGTSVVAFVVALAAGSIAVAEQDEAVVAQSLVQTQLEYIKSCTYNPEATTYPTVDAPEGYTISVGVTSIPDTDADIQKITVTVSRESATIITVADYKVNR